jgi:tetrahydromethanopterin S-methyltransferase subunit B
MISVFAVFLGIVAGLMAVALIALLVTLIVQAVRSRSHGVKTIYRD